MVAASGSQPNVRHPICAAQVADPDYRFARRGRSRAGGDRLHLGLLVAPPHRQAAAAGGAAVAPTGRVLFLDRDKGGGPGVRLKA